MAQQLRAMLDELWREPAKRKERAVDLAGDLTLESWLVLAAWDTAASCGPAGGRLAILPPREFKVQDDWGRDVFSAELVSQTHDDHRQPLVGYGEGRPSVVCLSGNPQALGAPHHDAASLLVAMQLIRDHVDSTLLKPHDLRQTELDQLARVAGHEPDHFRRLALWHTTIANLL